MSSHFWLLLLLLLLLLLGGGSRPARCSSPRAASASPASSAPRRAGRASGRSRRRRRPFIPAITRPECGTWPTVWVSRRLFYFCSLPSFRFCILLQYAKHVWPIGEMWTSFAENDVLPSIVERHARVCVSFRSYFRLRPSSAFIYSSNKKKTQKKPKTNT